MIYIKDKQIESNLNWRKCLSNRSYTMLNHSRNISIPYLCKLCRGVSFYKALKDNLSKRYPTQVFFCEYYKIFINTFFCRTRPVVASATPSKYFWVILLKRGKTIELPLHKKGSFKLRISHQEFPADLVMFTEEILNGKLRFLCSVVFFGKSEFRMNGIKIIWRKSSQSEVFGKFSRKHLLWNLFSVKLFLQKTTGIFLLIFENFSKPLFYRTPAYSFFCWYFS